MNANTGHIINVDKSDDVIRNDAGVQQTLPRDSLAVKGVQLAYSATAHDYQGSTVDRVLMAMESKEQLATQKSFYVGLSRMRDNTELVTDDVGKLIDTIQKHSGERVLALEAIAEQTASQATQTLAVRTASEVANSPAQAALDKRPSGYA